MDHVRRMDHAKVLDVEISLDEFAKSGLFRALKTPHQKICFMRPVRDVVFIAAISKSY
jgi:hypothetical protein